MHYRYYYSQTFNDSFCEKPPLAALILKYKNANVIASQGEKQQPCFQQEFDV